MLIYIVSSPCHNIFKCICNNLFLTFAVMLRYVLLIKLVVYTFPICWKFIISTIYYLLLPGPYIWHYHINIYLEHISHNTCKYISTTWLWMLYIVTNVYVNLYILPFPELHYITSNIFTGYCYNNLQLNCYNFDTIYDLYDV